MQTEEPAVVTPENTEPETQSWRDIVQPWWKAMLSILPIFLLTRFIFVFLGYIGGVLFTAADFAATSVSYHDLLANWKSWRCNELSDTRDKWLYSAYANSFVSTLPDAYSHACATISAEPVDGWFFHREPRIPWCIDSSLSASRQ